MTEERRCDVCQRLVLQWSDHNDYDCKNWPEVGIGEKTTYYKGYAIDRLITGKWTFAYKEGNRTEIHIGRTPVDCFMQIDGMKTYG